MKDNNQKYETSTLILVLVCLVFYLFIMLMSNSCVELSVDLPKTLVSYELVDLNGYGIYVVTEKLEENTVIIYNFKIKLDSGETEPRRLLSEQVSIEIITDNVPTFVIDATASKMYLKIPENGII